MVNQPEEYANAITNIFYDFLENQNNFDTFSQEPFYKFKLKNALLKLNALLNGSLNSNKIACFGEQWIVFNYDIKPCDININSIDEVFMISRDYSEIIIVTRSAENYLNRDYNEIHDFLLEKASNAVKDFIMENNYGEIIIEMINSISFSKTEKFDEFLDDFFNQAMEIVIYEEKSSNYETADDMYLDDSFDENIIEDYDEFSENEQFERANRTLEWLRLLYLFFCPDNEDITVDNITMIEACNELLHDFCNLNNNEEAIKSILLILNEVILYLDDSIEFAKNFISYYYVINRIDRNIISQSFGVSEDDLLDTLITKFGIDGYEELAKCKYCFLDSLFNDNNSFDGKEVNDYVRLVKRLTDD